MLTIEWQNLSPRHGYELPDAVADAGVAARFDDALERSAALHDVLATDFPEQAAYAVSLAYRMRYVMQMNAREAMHLCELRSSPQGHPSYRRIAQAMHTLHRRTGRAPRDRERDVVRRPRDVRPRTLVGRTRRGGPARRAWLTEFRRRGREKSRATVTCTDARLSLVGGSEPRARPLDRRGDLRRNTRRPQRPRGTCRRNAAPTVRGQGEGGAAGGCRGDQVENVAITRLLGRPGYSAAPTVSWRRPRLKSTR